MDGTLGYKYFTIYIFEKSWIYVFWKSQHVGLYLIEKNYPVILIEKKITILYPHFTFLEI